MSKKYTVNQGFMSLLIYYLEDDRHLARHHPHRRGRRRCRAYAPTSNTASYDNHEKVNSWVSLISFLYGYGAPLGGPSGRRSSAIMQHVFCLRLAYGLTMEYSVARNFNSTYAMRSRRSHKMYLYF